MGVSRQSAFVVGPALAGSIYSVAGSSAVFGLNAATFLVSTLLLALARPRAFEPEPGEGTFREIVAGARYVASVPWLWIGIAATALVLMVAMAPFQTLLPKFVQQQFGRGVGSYGLLLALQAAGMLVGTVVFGRVDPQRRRIVQFLGFLALNDALGATMALVHSFDAAMVLLAARGLLIGYAISLWGTLVLREVPESKLSRVTSLDFFGSTGLLPVGYALTAVVAPFFTPATIIFVGFSLATVFWGAPLLSRRVREAA